MPGNDKIKILLVEDNPGDARLVKEALVEADVEHSFSVVWVERLEKALAQLSQNHFDITLLDLSLPDSNGIKTFSSIQTQFPQMPLVILTGLDDEQLGRQLIRTGAQDYLLKGQVSNAILVRSIRYALERKQADQELRESQLRYQTLADASPVGIFRTDSQGQTTYVNPRWCKISNLSTSQAMGDGWLAAVHPADRDRVTTEWKRAALEQRMSVIEYRFMHPDGSIAWVIGQATPEFDTQGAIIGFVGSITDITAQKQLKASLQLGNAALEAAANAVVITDRSGTIEWVNPAWCELTGYSLAEVLDQNPRLLKSGKQDRSFYAHLWETILAGKTWRGELVNRRKDGSLYDEEETITPVKDDAGEITHFIGIKQNISNRKRSGRLLEARLRLNTLSLTSGIVELLQKALDEAEALTDSQIGFFHFVQDDQATISLQTWSTNTLLNMCQAEGNGQHYPVGQAGMWADAIRDHQPHIYNDYPSLPYRNGLPQGHAPIKRFLAIPLIQGDQVVAILGVGNRPIGYQYRDIETIQQLVADVWQIILRKQAELQLQRRYSELEALYENGLALSHLMTEKEISQKLIDVLEKKLNWHHAAVRVYHEGTETSDERDAETNPDVLSGLYVPLKVGAQILGAVAVDSDQEVSFTEKDEQLLVTLVNQASIAISNARHFSALQAELVERKIAEEQVRQINTELERRVEERTADLSRVNEALEQAMRVKDEFLASMSHELRTPLTAILGLSEAMQLSVYGALNEKQLKGIQIIESSGHHLLALINDILDLAKIEASKMELKYSPIAVSEICQASLQMVKGLANQKRLNVQLDMLPTFITLQADSLRLKQMLVNLLGNAVKFTPDGGSIGLDVRASAAESVVCFTVWDTGIGIHPDEQVKLFQPFVQLNSGLARKYNGTGLGLSLVKRMAELHNGTVAVESTPGQGSRFTIILPWDAPEGSVPIDADKLDSDAQHTVVEKNTGVKILLIEDTESSLELIREYLNFKGYHVEAARDGSEGLAVAKGFQPDLILMDIQLPDMDGIELTRIFRGLPMFKNTPIIAITALAMPDDRERCLAAGMDDYLSKPVNLKDLAQVIDSQLDRR